MIRDDRRRRLPLDPALAVGSASVVALTRDVDVDEVHVGFLRGATERVLEALAKHTQERVAAWLAIGCASACGAASSPTAMAPTPGPAGSADISGRLSRWSGPLPGEAAAGPTPPALHFYTRSRRAFDIALTRPIPLVTVAVGLVAEPRRQSCIAQATTRSSARFSLP